MLKKYKKTLLIGGIVSTIILSALGIIRPWKSDEVVLELGVITGSNWDVASATSLSIIDNAIARFEKEHEGVRVEYDSGVLKDEYSEWLSRKILNNTEPDVFVVLGTDFNQFSSMGLMKDLKPFMEQDDQFSESKYFTSAFKTGQYEGHQYALPYETVPTLMFVNKTLLTEEGIAMPSSTWTWEDLYDICEKVTKDTDGDGVLDQFGIYNYSWTDAVYTNGGELFNSNGSKYYFTEEHVVESVQFIRDLNQLNSSQKLVQEDFNNGKVAFMPLTFAEYRTYKTYPYRIKKYNEFQWECITMPSGKLGDNTSMVNTLLMGISSSTKEDELAWELLKFLTYDEETQEDIFRYSQGVSVLKSVTCSQEMENIVKEDMDEGERVISGELLATVIEEGYIKPQFKKYDQAMALADAGINDILENEKEIESGLKILQRTIDEYLHQ